MSMIAPNLSGSLLLFLMWLPALVFGMFLSGMKGRRLALLFGVPILVALCLAPFTLGFSTLALPFFTVPLQGVLIIKLFEKLREQLV